MTETTTKNKESKMTEKIEYGILVEKDYGNGEYGHIRAIVVRFDEEDGKPRGICSIFPDKDWQFYDGLQVNCQMDSHEDNRSPYAFKVEYKDIHSAGLRKINKMQKTLKKIDNKMRKFDIDFGAPKTFGEYVVRVANTIKAKTIVFFENDEPQHTNYSLNNYDYYKDKNQAIEKIDEMAKDVKDNLTKYKR